MARRMRDRRMRDRASRRMRDRAYGRSMDYGYYGPEYHSRHDYRTNERQQSSRMGRDYEYDREHSMDYNYYDPVNDYARGRSRRDMRYDYGSDEYLSDDELMDWSKDLMHEVEEKDKPYFTKDNMERRAKDLGIDFKDFTFAELYTTALMMYTDFGKTLGTSNMDIFVRLAKDWLCDEDAELQYGEKLASYYDNIVEGM